MIEFMADDLYYATDDSFVEAQKSCFSSNRCSQECSVRCLRPKSSIVKSSVRSDLFVEQNIKSFQPRRGGIFTTKGSLAVAPFVKNMSLLTELS